jgi:hypothetical protein
MSAVITKRAAVSLRPSKSMLQTPSGNVALATDGGPVGSGAVEWIAHRTRTQWLNATIVKIVKFDEAFGEVIGATLRGDAEGAARVTPCPGTGFPATADVGHRLLAAAAAGAPGATHRRHERGVDRRYPGAPPCRRAGPRRDSGAGAAPRTVVEDLLGPVSGSAHEGRRSGLAGTVVPHTCSHGRTVRTRPMRTSCTSTRTRPG